MQALPSLNGLLREKRKERARRGVYNPMLPGGVNTLAMHPAEWLEAFGKVQDNATKQKVDYRVDTVNPRLTNIILNYIDDPGYDENGLPDWLAVVGSRQSTKSTNGTYGLTSMAAREPGTEAFIIADTNERSKYLYNRAVQLYENLPARLRTPLKSDGTTKALVFHPDYGGSLSFYSAERQGGMVGFSGKVGQISEIPFMQDPGKTLSVLLPALYHQTESRLLLESTPAPPTYNGADYWKNMIVGGVSEEASDEGRIKVAFSPWWESKLNSIKWKDKDVLTNEEIDLLNLYGEKGLTKGNLAYRRMVMRTDEEIKKNPAFFDVWYPSSLTTCWGSGNFGLFSDKVLERHVQADHKGRIAPFEIEDHRRIIIGADPAGLLGGADHAAMCVLACDQESWQVAEVASARLTTHEFVDDLYKTAKKYHRLTGEWPAIAVESNGVGAATLALLMERGYPNIYYEKSRKPGINASKTSNNRMVAEACEALMNAFDPLWSLPLYLQLASYSGDRTLRTSEVSLLINGLAKGRRERQHWDLASAFLIAVDAASHLPLPLRPYKSKPIHVPVRGYTPADYLKQREEYEAYLRQKNGR